MSTASRKCGKEYRIIKWAGDTLRPSVGFSACRYRELWAATLDVNQWEVAIFDKAAASPGDEDFFIDELAQIDGAGLDVFVREYPSHARKLVRVIHERLGGDYREHARIMSNGFSLVECAPASSWAD